MEKSMTLGSENELGEARDASEKEDELFSLSEASKAPNGKGRSRFSG